MQGTWSSQYQKCQGNQKWFPLAMAVRWRLSVKFVVTTSIINSLNLLKQGRWGWETTDGKLDLSLGHFCQGLANLTGPVGLMEEKSVEFPLLVTQNVHKNQCKYNVVQYTQCTGNWTDPADMMKERKGKIPLLRTNMYIIRDLAAFCLIQ